MQVRGESLYELSICYLVGTSAYKSFQSLRTMSATFDHFLVSVWPLHEHTRDVAVLGETNPSRLSHDWSTWRWKWGNSISSWWEVKCIGRSLWSFPVKEFGNRTLSWRGCKPSSAKKNTPQISYNCSWPHRCLSVLPTFFAPACLVYLKLAWFAKAQRQGCFRNETLMWNSFRRLLLVLQRSEHSRHFAVVNSEIANANEHREERRLTGPIGSWHLLKKHAV